MLPQTDRASVTICVTKILGALGPPPLDGGVADPQKYARLRVLSC